MLTLTPEQRAELDALDELAEAIAKVFPTADLDLQPTPRACILAAQAALAVLQAHELGQTVTPGGLPPRARANGHKPGPKAKTAGTPGVKALAGTGRPRKPGEQVACPDCGKMLLPSSLWAHKKKMHPAPAAA